MAYRSARLWVVLLVGAGALVLPAAPASGSCVASVPTSAVVFTGTVTAVDLDARVATVRTDDGRVVQVVGSPDPTAVATSVDRRFVVGSRYEFHPTNDTSPYQDNACTATRQLGRAEPGGGPGWLVTVVVGTLAVVAAVIVGGLVVARERRHRAGGSGQRSTPPGPGL
jgi:hypothetical protein